MSFHFISSCWWTSSNEMDQEIQTGIFEAFQHCARALVPAEKWRAARWLCKIWPWLKARRTGSFRFIHLPRLPWSISPVLREIHIYQSINLYPETCHQCQTYDESKSRLKSSDPKGVRVMRRMRYFIQHRNVMNKILQKPVCGRILMFHVRRPQIRWTQCPLFSLALLWWVSKQRAAEKPCERVNIVSTPAKLRRKRWNATNAVGRVHHMFLAQMLRPGGLLVGSAPTFQHTCIASG